MSWKLMSLSSVQWNCELHSESGVTVTRLVSSMSIVSSITCSRSAPLNIEVLLLGACSWPKSYRASGCEGAKLTKKKSKDGGKGVVTICLTWEGHMTIVLMGKIHTFLL